MDGRNVYGCFTGHPRHLSSHVDAFRFSLIYRNTFGGASAITTAMFTEINGFSNQFYGKVILASAQSQNGTSFFQGWGGEDDDMGANRLSPSGYTILRTEAQLGWYRSLIHTQETRTGDNDKKFKEKSVLRRKNKKSFQEDGLSDLNYTLVATEQRPLYHHVLVHV